MTDAQKTIVNHNKEVSDLAIHLMVENHIPFSFATIDMLTDNIEKALNPLTSL